MPEQTQESRQSIALNVKLVPVDHSDQPIAANYTTVMAAQGIAYVDFGFIEPGVLAMVARAAQGGKPFPKALQGKLGARVSLGLDAALRLHQQLQQILAGARNNQPPTAIAGPQAAA